MKREVYWLMWNKVGEEWVLSGQNGTAFPVGPLRRPAEATAREFCRGLLEQGRRVQLKVKNRRGGRISFEATYGADPRRSRG